jgi:hypothetical protein
MQLYNTPSGSCMETGPPHRGQGGHRRRSFHRWWALVDLRHCLPWGPPSMFLSVDFGCSRISVTAFQGPRHQCFLALMVGAPRPSAPPPRGPPLMTLSVDGGRSRTSDIASQGAHHRYFLALMVGAPGPRALPPRGSDIDVS